MRTVVSLVAAGVLLVLPATATGAGVKGRVVDRTCSGPCVDEGGPAPPYGGEATVVAKRPGESRRAGRDAVKQGRFRIQLPPGHYRIKVKIGDPCWTESAHRVTVKASAFAQVRLAVANTCVL